MADRLGGPLQLVPLQYCSPCRAERLLRVPSFGRRTLTWTAVSVCLLALQPTRPIGWFAANLLLLELVSLGVVIPIHEIGHAIAGRLVGLDVVAIVLGHGRTVWSGHVAGVPIDVRAWPTVGGATLFGTTRSTWLRFRMFVAVLGGPLANVACLIGCSAWFGLAMWQDAGRVFAGLAPLTGFWLANAYALLANLLPRRVQGANGANRTDGAHLLRLLWPRRIDFRGLRLSADLRQWQKRRDGTTTSRRARSRRRCARHPTASPLASLVGIALVDAGSFARRVRLGRAGRAQEPALRALMQNNVAFADFMLDADELQREADARCFRALALPTFASVLGTRGSVLLWLGRPEEGLPLLERSFAAHEVPRDRATNACALSMGYHARGDARAASRWIDIARRLDPRCRLLDRAAAMITRDDEDHARAVSGDGGLRSVCS